MLVLKRTHQAPSLKDANLFKFNEILQYAAYTQIAFYASSIPKRNTTTAFIKRRLLFKFNEELQYAAHTQTLRK